MKYLNLIFSLLISLVSFADAWDNLTKEEALAVVNYLQENPYIFDYCDCCQSHDDEDDTYEVQLIKVTNTRIVECSWDKSQFSVEYDYQAIASILFQEDGSGFEIMPPPEQAISTPTIYMNYTWGLNEESGQAMPLFESIDYHYVAQYGGRSCNNPFSYPSPAELEPAGTFKAYKQWYKKARIK